MAIQNAAFRGQPNGRFGLGQGPQSFFMGRGPQPNSPDPRISGVGDGMRYGQPMPDGRTAPPAMYSNQIGGMSFAEKMRANGPNGKGGDLPFGTDPYFGGQPQNHPLYQGPRQPMQLPSYGTGDNQQFATADPMPLPPHLQAQVDARNGGYQQPAFDMSAPPKGPALPMPNPAVSGDSFAEPFFKTGYQEAFRQYNQGGPKFFGGPTIAGFSPQQLASQRQLQGLAPNLQQQGQLQQAALANQLGQDVRQFNLPGQINAPGQVGQVGNFGDLQGQINAPDQVGQVGAGQQVGREGVQGISSDLQRAITNPILQQLQDQTLPGISSGAAQAGAFGGSRQGILENQARTGATGAIADALARATLQQRGQDINQRGQDIQQGQFGSNLGVQQRGQDIQQGQFGANLGVGQRQFDIGTGLQSRGQDLNQRGQDIQQGQFGSTFLSGQRQNDIGSQLQQRGQNLGAISAGQGAASGVRQGLMAGPGLLGGVGAQQQQMNQKLIDAARQRFDFGQNSQQQQLAKLFGFLGGRPDFANDGTTPASGTSSAIADATDAYNLYKLITG